MNTRHFAIPFLIFFLASGQLNGQDPASTSGQTEETSQEPIQGEQPQPNLETGGLQKTEQASQGQKVESKGRQLVLSVKRKGTGRPLRRVEIKKDDSVFFSDPQGQVTLDGIQDDDVYSVYLAGFLKETFTVKEAGGKEAWEIFLTPDQPSDDEVVIRGVRKPEVSKKTVSIAEAKAVAPRGDPGQVTKLLPGVITPGFRPDVVVRGSAPGNSRYLIDGLDVPFIYHSIGGFSVVPEKLLSDVEFSAGGFGPQYGEATGGVIVLQTKSNVPEEDLTQFVVNLPLYSGIFYEKRIDDDRAFSIAARRSYLDVFLKRLPGDMTVVPFFADGHMQYLHRHEKGYSKTTLIASQDGLELLFPADAADESGSLRFDINTGFVAFGSEISTSLSDGWRYVTTPQIIHTKVKNDIANSYINITSTDIGLPFELQKQIKGRERFYLGLEPRLNFGKVEVFAPRFVNDEPFNDFEEAPQVLATEEFTGSNVASWLAYDQRVGSLVATPGIRAFYSSVLEDVAVDPRFSLRYELSKDSRLKGAVGMYSISPAPQESSKDYGNSDLQFEKSIHYILGWEEDWSRRWNTDLQLYFKRGYDVVRSDPIKRFSNDGEERSRGFELFLRRNKTERVFGWLSYTYSITEERKSADAPWGPTQYDQTHVVNLVGNYAFTGQWSLGGRINYHTGEPYTAVDSAVYNANLDKYQPRYLDADRYGSRLPEYYQLDVYSVYDFLFDRWKLKFRAGVEYLALERPVFGVTYNYDYSKEEYFRGVPPIPYLEISGEL